MEKSKPYVALIIPIAIILIFFFALNDGSEKEQEFEFNYDPQNALSDEVNNVSNNGAPQDLQNPIVKPQEEKYTNIMNYDKNKKQYAILSTTQGDIKIELNFNMTPITASNFWELSSKNFYDGTIFHRVLSGFMIQGGDPQGTGTGGPGYKFDDEPFEGEYTRGTVAMANSGPNTNGSQFFIMHEDNPLPKNYVIFGKVVEGMDIVDKIANAQVKANPLNPTEVSSPVVPVKITKATVIEE